MSFSARTAALTLLLLVSLAPYAVAHGGGSVNYISQVRAAPGDGVTVAVQDRDDRLEVRNKGKRTVTIYGYNREPYARILSSGQVQVNQRSPALYLNEDRYAEVKIPTKADSKAAPQWKTLDNTGAFDWHDHRIHWMVKSRPGKVKDPDQRTKIFDWKVPVRVGSQPATVRGDLYWVPKPGGSFPLAAGIALAALVGASIVLVVVVRRRRSRGSGPAAPKEAW